MLTTAQYSRATLSRQRLRFSDRKITTFSLILKIFPDIFLHFFSKTIQTLQTIYLQSKINLSPVAISNCESRRRGYILPICYSLDMAVSGLSYFQSLAYFELGFRVDTVELAQAAHCHVVACRDCTECVALLDLVCGCSRRFARFCRR